MRSFKNDTILTAAQLPLLVQEIKLLSKTTDLGVLRFIVKAHRVG